MSGPETIEPDELRFGAVAFLDVLGFKGMWSRHPAGAVVRKLRSITFSRGLFTDPDLSVNTFSLRSSVLSLSDTFVVSAAVTALGSRDGRDDLVCKVAALTSVCSKAAMIFAMMAGEPLPMICRGAVSVGDFFHDDRFVIGPAIDEAAKHERLAEAGLVWLSPSAQEVVCEAQRVGTSDSDAEASIADVEPLLVADYRVPIKGGEFVVTSVLNPFAFVFDKDRFLRTVEACFDVNADVRLQQENVQFKKENTMAFLRHALTLPSPRELFLPQRA